MEERVAVVDKAQPGRRGRHVPPLPLRMCTHPKYHNTVFGLLYSDQSEGEYNHLAIPTVVQYQGAVREAAKAAA